MRIRLDDRGFTVAEMAISIIVVSIVALSTIGLFTALVKSSVIAKRKAVASTLATNQMEYLKSLPYDSLAVAGGSIYSTNPLPATTTSTIDNVKYSVKTAISFVDDAYDGCGSYPTQQLKQTYCRNYPAPASAPNPDTNPQDYKIADVSVSANGILASVDTQISAKVAETASTTGALFITVIDDSGNPVSGANVNVTNSTVTPNLNLNDNTDENGIAIFYGLPPDTGNDYSITGSLTGYSSLTTIKPSGSLQPNYLSQNIITQQSSSVTLTLKPMSSNSLVLETTNTSGSPLSGMRVYVKGGYKKYTSAADTQYYFDNVIPSDTRPTTDGNGLASISNLVPGNYIFCGDAGATSCRIGGTTYYLAAAVAYGNPDSNNVFSINVPTYQSSNAPGITYSYGGTEYIQKVRLMLTTDSSFPRVFGLHPYTVSRSGSTISDFDFNLTGQNLSNANVSFKQGSNTFNATCSGTSTNQDCSVNLSSAAEGKTQMVVTVGSRTLTLPVTPEYGGIVVGP